MATEQSLESAWKAILAERKRAVEAITDASARKILTEAFLREVYQLEWNSQFDDRRSEVQAKVRQMVNDAMDELKLGDQA